MTDNFLNEINWNDAGLVAAVAQDVDSGQVLMMAWMNRESLALSVERGEAVYWSRSRQQLWHKGEVSGNTQRICEMRLDCDADVVLLRVEQRGGVACHTGRQRCFFRRLHNGEWETTDPVLCDPKHLYGQNE